MNKIGVVVNIGPKTDFTTKLNEVKQNGFSCCQLVNWYVGWDYDALADRILQAVDATGVEISTFWAGWSRPVEWNFTGGPVTLGLVPPAYRMQRAEELIAQAKLAKAIGVKNVATHAGFLPENMTDPEYPGVIAILRYVVDRFQHYGVNFLFETGQETPVTLLRVIEEIGGENVGVNMDTANLILYGKGNSADAISVFGKYVLDTHIKDGFYPTDGKKLGRQVKVGLGVANVPEVIRRLQLIGYQGNYIIEREISGEQQTADILDTKVYLENILKEYH